jgi:hypothetical protein
LQQGKAPIHNSNSEALINFSKAIFVARYRLIGEICGSPIRSNGRRKLGSRSPRTRCGIARLQLFLFVASCLSNQFALSGKRYAVTRSVTSRHWHPSQ